MLRQFEIGDENDVKGQHTGVEVTVSGIDQSFPSLINAESASLELSRRLALYLKKYPGIEIVYSDLRVDPATLESHTATYGLVLKNNDDKDVPSELTIIEWKTSAERALYLCDA